VNVTIPNPCITELVKSQFPVPSRTYSTKITFPYQFDTQPPKREETIGEIMVTLPLMAEKKNLIF
jgi:hypothetical protein